MHRLYFLPLTFLGAFLGALIFLGRNNGLVASGVALALAGFVSAACGFWALKKAGALWNAATRVAWTCIALSGVAFGAGCLLKLRDDPAEALRLATPADWLWVAQQPLLLLGLFLLAWRDPKYNLLRLLTDTLIVVLAVFVLSWGLLIARLLDSQQFSTSARFVALSYPLFDSAHLFCGLILLLAVRGQSAFARVVWWLFGGVLCLISADSISSYFFLTRAIGLSPWLDVLQGAASLFFGAAALTHALSSDESYSNSRAQESADQIKKSIWERTLGRWYRGTMLWLPYAATLGVSTLLIVREMRGNNPEAIQRLMPVLALLLAIVARQMITLLDNVRLSEELRARARDLEQNVGDRTRHLATLHAITSTLSTSLDRRTVLRITLEQTISAIGAQGGGIWLRDTRHNVYEVGVPEEEWTLVHWQGFEDVPSMPSMLRELSIAEAGVQTEATFDFQLSPSTRDAMQKGLIPLKNQLIQLPVSSQGKLLGVMALARTEGKFEPSDRALVESVALEAGTALQNARLYSEAAELANRDSVTRLFNHRAVQEKLHETLSRCRRSGGQFSIVMMDLNNFKFFNDTYGHPVGDDVLRNVARALEKASRESDVLGRYGGDEFIMLLPDTDAQGTLDACARIKTALDSSYLEPVAGTRLPISISFGWSSYPADGDNVLELLTAADQHLYNHKRGDASRLISGAKAADQDELRRLKTRAVGGSFGVLDALVTAIDNKDHYTRHHSEEVTYLSLLVARELNYSEAQLEAVRISGLLHDVGKIAVPDDVLRHPGKLNREQWNIMQQHPVFGALIVKDVPHLDAVSDGIKYHHEKWDGSGYPENRVGEDIPVMGRLLAMGDCYSALTTDRPYRKGWTPEAALEEIAKCAGTHFDPNLCAIFLRVMERELEIDSDKSDYSARITDDFGQLAKEGLTKSDDPIITRETVPITAATSP